MIKVEDIYLNEIKSILRLYAHGWQVWAFGSRVDGTSKKYSDFDLVVIGDIPLDWQRFIELKNAFSESDLPFLVDVLNWHSISPEFRKVIKKEYEVIQKG